jgi:hypothetical protein
MKLWRDNWSLVSSKWNYASAVTYTFTVSCIVKTSYGVGPGLIPGESMYDLWWTTYNGKEFSPDNVSSPFQNHITKVPYSFITVDISIVFKLKFIPYFSLSYYRSINASKSGSP